jgi:predicted Fe-Mo cluster-binding NifX family protein
MTQTPDAVRVAIPSERPGGLEAPRSGHFGRSECFTFVEVTGGQIGEVTVVRNPAHREGGCMMPVLVLEEHRADVVVVAGIGGRPLAGCRQLGIDVRVADGVLVRDALQTYLDGATRPVGPDTVCRH